jgi:drug/metabolite transporter (DMT)-like permease
MSAAGSAPARPAVPGMARVDARLVLWMLLLTAMWGLNAQSIKALTTGMGPLLGAGLRGLVALAALTPYGLLRGESLRYRGRLALHGMVVGVLFGLEFCLFYVGSRFTTGGHVAIFINMAPFFVALGAHYLLPGDRLHRMKSAGLLLAFAGVVTLFSNDLFVVRAGYWVGDAMVLAGAGLWGATTLYIKRTLAGEISAFRVLYVQILVSTPLLLAASLLLEAHPLLGVTPLILANLAFQGLVVVFFSYLMWFVLLERYPASTTQSFTFLSPIWGVSFGALLLGEAVQPLLLAGIALVGLGLYLVSRPPLRPRA